MSTEVDSPQPKIKKHRKLKDKDKDKDKDVDKSDRKRKRLAVNEIKSGSASPTRKHKSSQLPESPRAQSKPIVEAPGELVSPFYQQTSSFYLTLPPISQKHALQGICAEHISPLILTYYPPFHGVIISYSNARLSTDPQAGTSKPAYARAIDEYASSFIWLTANFVIFKPQKHSTIEGYVNLQSESTIGLLCLNFFNANIERKRLPKEWKWIPGGMRAPRKRKLKKAARDIVSDSEGAEAEEDDLNEQSLGDAEGYFQDQGGKRVEGLLRFRVKNVDTSKSMDRETGFVSIEGTMLSEDDERQLLEQERIRKPATRRKQLGWQIEPRDAMFGALLNGFDGEMDLDDTQNSKHRVRHGLSPVQVLWTLTSTVRPPLLAAGNSITISQFLEQVNDVLPLESEDWGLEDYSVEVRGFECLHFSELNQVLKEDDEVCIRPLQTHDLRFRKISGRHQIAADGKHLIDGVAFGRPFLRRADRPAIRIPPRKRRRITYDGEDDLEIEDPNEERQVMIRAGFDNADGVTMGDESDGDEDFAPDDEEDDLFNELGDLQNDLNGAVDTDDSISRDYTQPQRITRSRKSPKGLGLLELVDDHGRPFPGPYNNPLLDLYGQDEAPTDQSEIRARKRGSTDLTPNSSENIRSILRGSSTSPQYVSRRDSAGSTRNVRFENAEPATPATVRESEDSDDADDGDFELGEVDESDKENAEPQDEETELSDSLFEGSQSSSSTSSDDQQSADETSSSGSSLSSSSSDPEPEQQPSKPKTRKSGSAEMSETSSSGPSSSSSSDSESELPKTVQERKWAVHDVKSEMSPSGAQPAFTASTPESARPGNKNKQTRSRNKRKRESKKLSFIKSKGILPATATKSDLRKFEEETTESERQQMIAIGGVSAAFEAKRQELLTSIAAGSIDIGQDPSLQMHVSGMAEDRLPVDDTLSKAAATQDNIRVDQPASEEGSRKPRSKILSANNPTNTSTTAEYQDSQTIMPAEARERPLADTTSVLKTATWPGSDTSPRVEARNFSVNDPQSTPGAVEASKAITSLTPESQHRRSKLDMSGAKRMVFGSLGLRTPKTKEDEIKTREKLMKDIRPAKGPHFSEKIETIEDTAAAADDESWKDKIDLRAVECCYEGIEYSTPPFPFVQRWDPQQQRGYRMGNAQKRKGKKRKRNSNDYYEDGSYHQNSKVLRFEDNASGHEAESNLLTEKANAEGYDQEEPHDERNQDSVRANQQLLHETEGASADTLVDLEGTHDLIDDLPTLPKDLSTTPSLTIENAIKGNIVAFKQLEMSAETNWQPKISEYRSAIVDEILDDGTLSMTLAKRDQPSKQIQYNERTGERLYSKFEMPDYSDGNGDERNGKLEISFDELISPVLIEAASEEGNGDVLLQGQDHDHLNGQTITGEAHDIDASVQGVYQNNPIQEVPKTTPAELSEEARHEISELIRDAGWRSSMNHELADGQDEDSPGQIEHLNKPADVRPSSPKFHGFTSSPLTNGFQVASSPPPAAFSTSGHVHASGSEVAESVSADHLDNSPAQSEKSTRRSLIDYPDLPEMNDESEVFQQEAQNRSGLLEADHQIESQDLTSSSSIRPSRSSAIESPILTSPEKNPPKLGYEIDEADSDESLPELFSQAWEKQMSQGTNSKPKPSLGDSISPPSQRKSKRKSRMSSSERESVRDWEPGSSQSEDEDGGESTPRQSQTAFPSQIVDLTISSDTVDPPDDSYVDEDSYILPKGPGWVQKPRTRESRRGPIRKTTRRSMRNS